MRAWFAIALAIQLVALVAHADDAKRVPPSPAAPTPSRALPIGLLALGIPMLVSGTLGIALDEDPTAANGPTYNDSAPAGVVGVISGTAFTAVGAYLFVSHAPPGPRRDRAWMKWAGVGAMGVAAIATALGVAFDLDRKQAIRDFASACDTGSCSGLVVDPIEARRDDATSRRDVVFVAGATLAVGGIALFFASREGDRGGPQVRVSGAGATIGWSTAF
ncbi:MAG: hypothetical protein H0T46_18910 [Deltaproteobacteria bacterium]|nr:hypothetical protein [Deltaproteobacteria bacterium]